MIDNFDRGRNGFTQIQSAYFVQYLIVLGH